MAGATAVTTTAILCPPAGIIAGAVAGGSGAFGGIVSAIVGTCRYRSVNRELREFTTSDHDPTIATLQDDLETYRNKVRDVHNTLRISNQQQHYNKSELIIQLQRLQDEGERFIESIDNARESLRVDEIRIGLYQ